MNRLSHIARAAIAAACLAQIAGAAAAQVRTPVSTAVLYADVDLASPAGKATFESRVRRAADRLCGTDTRDLSLRRDAERCRAEMVDSGRHQFAALRTRHDMQVAGGTGVVVASK